MNKLTMAKYKEIKKKFKLGALEDECFQAINKKEYDLKLNKYFEKKCADDDKSYCINNIWKGTGIYSSSIKNNNIFCSTIENLIMRELEIKSLRVFMDREDFIKDEKEKRNTKYIHVSYANNKFITSDSSEVKQKELIQEIKHFENKVHWEYKEIEDLSEEELLEYYRGYVI